MSQKPAHGAFTTIIGKISNNATWNESVYILINSSPSTGYANDLWTMAFREDECSLSPQVELTSASTTLTYTEVSTASSLSVLRISAGPETISGLDGDFICDLASESTSGFVTHWSHGRITFFNQPIR